MDHNNHLRNALPPKRMTLTPKTPQNSTNAGAVDEEVFLKAFEDTPKLNLPSLKEAEQEIRHLTTVLSDSKIDWQRRIETLRNFRGLLEAGIMDYKEISDQLKLLELPFQESVKDLRSQVVREACITISFMSEKLGVKCARFCEVLLATLLNLIPNSAKVVSSSALVCIRLILQHTRSPRLIPIVANGLNSKSKEIRKACCEFLDLIVQVWPTLVLAKQAPVISEAIKKGISDASPEARQYARKAFWGFSEHFKDQAQILLSSLDPSKQRVLFTDHPSLSNSSSTNSLSQCDSAAAPFTPRCTSNLTIRNHPVPSSNSVENLNRPPSSSNSRYRSGIPVYSSPRDNLSTQTPIRAVSAIDVSAARRARARAAIAVANAKSNFASGEMSLTGLRCTPTSSIGRVTNMITPTLPSSSSEKVLRSRSRVSQSQPTSRSTSPNSRGHSSTDSHNRAPRRRSGIALHSRETSPSRSTTSYSASDRLSSNSSAHRKLSAASGRDITPPISKALSTEKILQQSREAEVAMATALKTANQSKRYSFDDRSDESETSSICSDRSFASRTIENVNEILRKLSSSHWSDRKDGLLALQSLLRHSNRTLHIYELKRITEIFTKMLSDPHTKTFTLFLEILNELIVAYKDLLGDWLPKLLIKLFLKIGQDTLYSIQSRINETLELIRELFPFPNQLSVIIRFLSDPTSKPPLKSTLHALQYSNTLLSNMELGDWTSNSDNELDLAFRKIIAWTADPKSQDLRKVSSEVLINLFNLNQSEFLSIVNVLPKVPFQDTAFQIINRERKNLSTNSIASTSETPSRISISGLSFINNTSLTKVLEVQNQTDHSSENLENQESSKNGHSDDVFSSLKQTTDEIQKYKFETDPDSTAPNLSDPEKASKNEDELLARSSLQGREISSASKDSGISQIDANVRTNNAASPSSSPIHSKGKSSSPEFNSTSRIPDYNEKNSLEFISLILNESLTSSKDVEVQKEALQELIAMLKDQSIDWDKHFKEALKIILDKTSSGETSSIRALSYRALREFIQAHPDRFTDYIELIILKMLEASKDKEKEVQRAGESAAASVANILPLEPCLRVLRCVILLGELPMNQAAIKMLSKIIERQSEEKIEGLLSDMMPPLIQAYDNPESAVRKAAVFTMVTIHNRVGDKLKPYLTGLDGSKMKLLKLYIDRAKSQHSSECNSPSSPMILTI